MMAERGLDLAHTKIMRWVRYAVGKTDTQSGEVEQLFK